jgi:hypothetical protein
LPAQTVRLDARKRHDRIQAEKPDATPTQHGHAAPVDRNASGETRRTLILSLWGVLICCVVIGSLLPAASPVMVAIGRLHIWDKLQHFGAYLALSFLPVIGFRDRRRGLMAGLSMFLLGVLMEAGQHFPPAGPWNWET